MRQVTQEGLDLVKYFEGFSPVPYKDIAGYWTIGYGHLMSEYQDLRLSISEAEEILRHDLGKAERAVLRLIKVDLTDYQFDALVSFTFNLGSGALQRSTLRAKVNRRDYAGAAQEFLKWIRAGGKVSKGLLKRRRMESRIFLGLGTT